MITLLRWIPESLTSTLPKHLNSSEIWEKTHCIRFECSAVDAIESLLQSHAYSRYAVPKLWIKDQKQIIVCLVDDVRSTVNGYDMDLASLFDPTTLVITDNLINCSTQYSVSRLPREFFGIYGYRPTSILWNPKKDFAYQINRMDHRRCLLLLMLIDQFGSDRGHINFNADNRIYPGNTPLESWDIFWQTLSGEIQAKLTTANAEIKDQLPFCNYEIPFDLVPTQSWLTIVAETYASDDAAALSEKIFRCLVTPSPWITYAGRHTVSYLESLGLDCVSDLIDHSFYDKLFEAQNKHQHFIDFAHRTICHLKDLDQFYVQQRYCQAATHNQDLLLHWRERWPDVFKSWLDTMTTRLVADTTNH